MAVYAGVGGVVVDDNGAPVEGAAVVALHFPDSIYIAGTVTDLSGKFSLATPEEPDTLIISADAIGYEKNFILCDNNDSLTITLPHTGVSLSEVVVTPPKLSVSPGRFSFLPGDLVKDVNNAMELMEHVPLLRVSGSDITIIGKERCKVFINGKESIMSQAAIMQLLESSEPGRIKKVEVWLQPSISHQEDGSIINIVMKPAEYIMGSADIQAQSSFDGNTHCRQSGWVGIERGRWQFSTNVSVLENKYITDRETEYGLFATPSSPSEDETPYSWVKRSSHHTATSSYTLYPSIGASLDLKHNNSLGLHVHTNLESTDTDQKNNISISPMGENSDIIENTRGSFIPTHTIGRLNYYHTLDSLGSRLQASAIYSGLRFRDKNTYLPADVMPGRKSSNDGNSIQLKGSWNKRFNQKASMEVGFDSFYDKVTNRLDQSEDGSLTGPLTTIDDLCQQQYQFDLLAAFEYNFTSVFGISAGARARWYHRDITQYVNLADNDFESMYILPTATVSLSINPMHMLSLSYNSTLRQPQYYSTNPIVYWSSPDYYYTGNPNLKAELSHELSLYYMLLQKITLGGNLRFTNNISAQATLPQDDGVTYFMPLEAGHSRNSTVFAGYSDSFFSHRLNVYCNLAWTQTHLVNDKLPAAIAPKTQDDSQWGVIVNASTRLGKDRSWNISANLNYTPEARKTFITTSSFTNLTLYLSKQFKFGGRVQLSVINILNQKRSGWYECDTYSQSYRFTDNQREFLVQFTYNFGKEFRMRQNSGDSEFENR